MMKRFCACLTLALLAAPLTAARGEAIRLVENGSTRAVIVAASDAKVAAERLQHLLSAEVGANIDIVSTDSPLPADRARIVLCTIGSRDEIKKVLSARAQQAKLKPEGFLIESQLAGGASVVVIGAEAAGLRYGVGELWNFEIAIEGKSASIEAAILHEDAPAFAKRIFWNWDFLTNWDDDLSRVHQTMQADPGGKLQPYLEKPAGYENQFGRVVDYASDHKLNGLIIYGFINDNHGGVEAAQRLSRRAKANGVRILPGVGTVIYGGFYHAANDPQNAYSLTTWLSNHPEVRRMVGKDGKTIDSAPCPTAPELREFLTNGAKWFFKTFPDIGGVNIEHGDFFECQCEHCKAERAKPENDHNFLFDMMYTHQPVIRTGLEINPGLWYTFSPYWGYNEQMMKSPPRFLKQYPEPAIIQWTYSGMVDPIESNWPAKLKPPAGATHSIGLIHQGSYWYHPRQWWSSPGQTYALIPDIIRGACARAIDDASEGMEIVGQISSSSPQNELNYLAFEAFMWHPKMTLDAWIEQLAPLYGGADRARRFYELTKDDTVSAERVATAKNEARDTAAQLHDPRQVRRWKNLVRELGRREGLIKAGQTKPFGPGSLEGVQELKIEF